MGVGPAVGASVGATVRGDSGVAVGATAVGSDVRVGTRTAVGRPFDPSGTPEGDTDGFGDCAAGVAGGAELLSSGSEVSIRVSAALIVALTSGITPVSSGVPGPSSVMKQARVATTTAAQTAVNPARTITLTLCVASATPRPDASL